MWRAEDKFDIQINNLGRSMSTVALRQRLQHEQIRLALYRAIIVISL
jgi:hypothetical protein